MNKILVCTAASFLVFITAILLTSKTFSRSHPSKSTPIREEYALFSPQPAPLPLLFPDSKPATNEFQIPDNKWAKTIDVVTANSILIPEITVHLQSRTTETWISSYNNTLACGIFYQSSGKNRVLEAGTKLTVDWVKSGVMWLPGKRQSSLGQECVIKCHTEGGVYFHILLAAGKIIKLHDVPRFPNIKQWSGWRIHSPTIAETEQLWQVLLPPGEAIKVPWPL